MRSELNTVSPDTVRELWARCKEPIAAAGFLEEVAQILVDEMDQQFRDSLVLTRVFLTVPFQELPDDRKRRARDLAASTRCESLLGPHTPVLSLLATRGRVAEWNDVRSSALHLALPLLSESYVVGIPMMASLLSGLGLPLTWAQHGVASAQGQTIGSEVGYFYVKDAARVVDERGRKIISSERFVAEHGVQSVFAVGGAIFGGAVLVLIHFSRVPVSLRTVRTFMPLINLLKATMIDYCSMAYIFRPNQNAAGDRRTA